MAHIVEVGNPFEPLRDTRVTEHPGGVTIREWLRLRFGEGFVDFGLPTVCVRNGQPVMRRDWDQRIEKDDVVNFVVCPGEPITILYVLYAVLVVATVVIAINAKQAIPSQGQTPEADPVYSLKGQRNQIRLGEPIEVPYGRVRMWPSYASQPYNKYQDNQQWLYQLFCLGQGDFNVESINIEDTPLANYQDVEYELCPPGTPVTLFPDNVVTSVEVGNIELFGPNEPEGNAVWVEDSEGDPEFDIEPTGHYGYSDATPFVANPTQTQTDKIELDVTLPRGLYVSQDNGGLGTVTVTALFEAREIDDAGAPVGSWFTLASFSKTLATVTPQRFTLECAVPLGRYEVRGARTNDKNTSARAGNTLMWEAMRAFLPNTRDYGDVTMLAMKARASNNLNDNAASRVNVVAVRKLRSWNKATQSWNAAAPTRSIVWAFADIFQNTTYGGRLADAYLDLDALADLNAVLTERDEFCDWIFDQRLTVWDAARLVANLARAVPMLNGSRVSMVRDEAKTLPTAVFNPENIVKGSFRLETKLAAINDHDGLEVEYTDPDTWKSETVPCLMPDEDGDNLEKIVLNGCTSREHAYHWGMWRRAVTRYVRQNVVFRTGMEGHIPSYGDLVSVCHDAPKWGTGGFVVAVDGPGTGLTLSEPVAFDGVSTYKIMLRKKDGAATAPITVTAGADELHVTLASAIDPDEFWFDVNREPPLFLFGKSNLVGRYARVTNLAPGDDDTVEVTATPYRSEPHSFDEYVPPAKGDTQGGLPKKPDLPSVVGLIVAKSANMPNEVVATWNPTQGADYYVAQLSYDGTTWETLSDYIEGTSIRFTVLPRYIYVRVAAVTTGMGGWAYWTGDAPVEKTSIEIDNDATPNGVSGVNLVAGFGMIWLEWANSTNAVLRKTRVFAAAWPDPDGAAPDQPLLPTFEITYPQAFFPHSGLPDAQKWSYWLDEESVGGKHSTVSGPHTAMTVNGITLDHLIPGGLQPVEIVSVIPSTGNYKGRMVFLTANDPVGSDYVTGLGFVADKLYKWEGLGTPTAKVNGKDKWTAAAKAVDLSGQIVGGQIADAAILNAKLADNAVSQAKLQDAIVSNAKLVDGAVDAVKLAAAAVTTAKIAVGAITTSVIAAGAITPTEIAANAVTTAKIAVGAITTSVIAAGAVTATEIASNAITTPKITAGAVVTASLAAGAVTTNELAAGAVTAAKITAGTITATEIASNAITTAKLDAAAVTTAKLAAGSVTANEIAANTVTAAKIAAGTITASEIAAGAITTAKINAGAITTNELAANAVTAAKIGAGEITTAKLAAGAVTTNELAANAVTAAKIAAGTITATQIAANAITATQLAADSVVAGKIQAGAVTATAVGTNEIIANTANIANGVITSAKIASLAAGKIDAGTLNAMTLTAGKIATDYQVFNTGAPASLFPVMAYQNAQEPSSPMTGFGGSPTYFWMITYWGWATGSGFVQDRFGKSSMNFLCLENGGCTPTVSGWVDLEIVCRINGGSPFQINPYAVRAISGNGSLNINGAVNLTGLGSTDTVEFGVAIKAASGSDQWNVANLTVLALNL